MKKLRVSVNDLVDIGTVSHYNNNPFTGIFFDLHDNDNVKSECEMVNGLKHGKSQRFSIEGKLEKEFNYINDKAEGESKGYYKNGQIEEVYNYINNKREGKGKGYYKNGQIKFLMSFLAGVQQGLAYSFYEDGNKKKVSTIIDGNYDGDQTEWLNNGKIKFKRVFKNDIEIKMSEWNSEESLIKESISEIKSKGLDYYGDEILFSSEVSLKEWKEGSLIKEELQYDYRNNTKYSNIKTCYKNGKLKTTAQFLVFMGSEIKSFEGLFKEFYETGNVKREGNYESNIKNGLWSYYFISGELNIEKTYNYGICESLKEWNKTGELIKENVLKNGDKRSIFVHEVMTKGGFTFELKDGTSVHVFGQRHSLVEVEEYYEDGEWIEEDKNEIDDFLLSGYNEGYLFDDDDLCELFNIEDYEWDFNGFGTGDSGAIDGDDNETRQQKWDDYKSKFSKLTSKEHLEITIN